MNWSARQGSSESRTMVNPYMCVKREEQDRAYDPIEVEPVTPWSGTERKVRELVESIKTGVPGVSNLRATMLGTEIGFGIYESHLQGGAAVHPPVPNRERWVSSW